MKNDRRNFLKQCGGVTAAAVTTTALITELAHPALAQNVPGTGRSYTAGRFALELDGQAAGWLSSVEGGSATADVVVESAATGQVLKKHIGGVKYEDISLECGYGMSDPFYNWMKDCFDRKASRKNGAIIACDFNYRELSRINFFNALITEIGMPALDATSKDAAKMTLKFTPEYTRLSRAAAGQKVIGLPISPKVQKQWLPANFRLRINDLEQATTRVNKIEALVIKQLMADNPTGTQRDYQKEPAHLEIPNLVFTVAEAYADQIYQWHEDFVIKGNCTDDKEKTGTLEFLAMDMTVLFTLSLDHLGIFKLTPDKAEANSDQIRRVKAELYCEDMAFKYTSAWS